MQTAAALPPAEGETFRFVAVAPEGRSASIYEARRTGGRAERTLVRLMRAPESTAAIDGWSVLGRDTRYLAGESFDYYVGLIDAAAVARPAPVEACEAPPTFFAAHGARTAAGGCPEDDPTGRIARALGLVDGENAPIMLK